jgi:ABC-2 type transport system permease protein
VLAAGLALLPALVSDDGERWTLAVLGSAPAGLERIAGAVAADHDATLTVRRERGRDAAALVRRDDVDAALVDGRRVVVDAAAGAELRRIVSTAADRARLVAAAADPTAADTAQQVDVQRVGVEADSAGESVVRFAGVLALFFAIATYGSWVLNSVLEEKSNRVVEIVVSAVAPRRLLAGKVIGNGLAGLRQLLALAAAALAAGLAGGGLSELPAGGAVTILAALGWFVLGFAFSPQQARSSHARRTPRPRSH